MSRESGQGFLPVKQVGGQVVTDSFGRESLRVTINSETSNQLLAGRILLIQTESENLDTGESVELAVLSASDTPITLLSLGVAAQISEVTLDVLEGGSGLGGGVTPAIINPNRINIPTPNTTVLEGTPTSPITGTDGVSVTPPSGWKLIGTEGPSDSQYVNDSVDIGGFLCAPNTWYQLRITNTSTQSGRPIQLSLKIIDPS
ncbi:hypothetical protein NVP1182O_05 [Vibrio phage 1.182.O._10N.286.46.E1]|nr:hypothetical protein NVP1182O_05 [Vibrio phage 1.182.O._10N.286.46.E1]